MLYIMIKPPFVAQRQVGGQRAHYGLDDSYPADRLHSTMLRLGDETDWPVAKLDLLTRLLGTIAVEPFQVMFDLIAGNLLRNAKGVPEARELHKMLRQKAEMCGVPIPQYDFWLHLTLAYRGTPIAAARKIDPIGWTVEEFLLIRSDRGHDVVDRWPLQQRQLALAL